MSRFQSTSSHRLGACPPPRLAPWHPSAPPAQLRPSHPVSAAAAAPGADAVTAAPSAESALAPTPPPSPPPDRAPSPQPDRVPSPLLQLESIHPCEERIVQRDDPPQQPARRAYPAARKLVKQTTVKW